MKGQLTALQLLRHNGAHKLGQDLAYISANGKTYVVLKGWVTTANNVADIIKEAHPSAPYVEMLRRQGTSKWKAYLKALFK